MQVTIRISNHLKYLSFSFGLIFSKKFIFISLFLLYNILLNQEFGAKNNIYYICEKSMYKINEIFEILGYNIKKEDDNT